MFEYLDRRYALALYEVAEEKGKVQEYLNDLREICDLIDNNKDFYEVVKHPQISTKQKKKTFINIFKGNIDEELLSFLLILIEKDRILFLREKLNEMEKIDLERKNTYRGIVKTTEPLSEEQYNKLLAKLEKKYNNQIAIIPKRRGKFKLAAGQSYSITMDADIFIELPEIISRAEAPEIKLYIARNRGTIHFGTPYAIRSIHTENSIGMFDYHYYNDLIVTYKFLPTNRIWAYSIECISR